MTEKPPRRRSLRCLLGYHQWRGTSSRDGRRSVCGRCGRIEYDDPVDDFRRRTTGQ